VKLFGHKVDLLGNPDPAVRELSFTDDAPGIDVSEGNISSGQADGYWHVMAQTLTDRRYLKRRKLVQHEGHRQVVAL
jgi:hypothetical protein